MKISAVLEYITRLLLIATVIFMMTGCGGNRSASVGVGLHGGTAGWGSSFSVGISNHHYRSPHSYRRRPRGP